MGCTRPAFASPGASTPRRSGPGWRGTHETNPCTFGRRECRIGTNGGADNPPSAAFASAPWPARRPPDTLPNLRAEALSFHMRWIDMHRRKLRTPDRQEGDRVGDRGGDPSSRPRARQVRKWDSRRRDPRRPERTHRQAVERSGALAIAGAEATINTYHRRPPLRAGERVTWTSTGPLIWSLESVDEDTGTATLQGVLFEKVATQTAPLDELRVYLEPAPRDLADSHPPSSVLQDRPTTFSASESSQPCENPLRPERSRRRLEEILDELLFSDRCLREYGRRYAPSTRRQSLSEALRQEISMTRVTSILKARSASTPGCASRVVSMSWCQVGRRRRSRRSSIACTIRPSVRVDASALKADRNGGAVWVQEGVMRSGSRRGGRTR